MKPMQSVPTACTAMKTIHSLAQRTNVNVRKPDRVDDVEPMQSALVLCIIRKIVVVVVVVELNYGVESYRDILRQYSVKLELHVYDSGYTCI